LPTDLESHLEKARLLIGALSARAWLIHALNRWIGRDTISQPLSSAA
jgi:hypothetical protein